MRDKLPARRPCLTTAVQFSHSDGRIEHYAASVGFDSQGAPREVFLTGARAGTDMSAVLNDAAVVISVALQSGLRAIDLRKSIARADDAPLSVIGAVLDLLEECEQQMGIL